MGSGIEVSRARRVNATVSPRGSGSWCGRALQAAPAVHTASQRSDKDRVLSCAEHELDA